MINDRIISEINSAYKRDGFENILYSATNYLSVMPEAPEYKLFSINKIIFDEKYPSRQSMENILASFNNPEFNIVYILSSDGFEVKLKLGVCRNQNYAIRQTNIEDVANILSSAFIGNFNGSFIEEMSQAEANDFHSDIVNYPKISLITGIPSIDDMDGNSTVDYQGIDRLINASMGSKWRIMIICEPMSSKDAKMIRRRLCSFYDYLHKNHKFSLQTAESESETNTKTKGKNKQTSYADNEGHTYTKEGRNSGDSDSKTDSKSRTTTETEQNSDSDSKANAKTQSITKSFEEISLEQLECMEYIEKILLKQINLGMGKGLFHTTIYAMSDNEGDLNKVQSLFCAIFQGSANSFNPLVPYRLKDDEISTYIVASLQNNFMKFQTSDFTQLLYGHYSDNRFIGTSTLLNSKDISMIAAIPQKEVLGLPMKEGVEFGLNIPKTNFDQEIVLGHLQSRGRKLDMHKVGLSKRTLNKHLFVTGVTGSGKTTTCQTILCNAKLPFIVIEPSKTEYRQMINIPEIKNLKIFTFGDESKVPFRLNPFELYPGENLSAHIDVLKAAFTKSFPMEAALPMVFEEAIYCCYQKYGWNTDTGVNYLVDNPYTDDGIYFPVLQDLIVAIDEVTKNKKFSSDMGANYIGSLVGRISNLLVGSKGQMLNCRKSIDIMELLDQNVIFELEELKSADDKSFVMGILISRISEAIKRKYYQDNNYKHITMLEEAHRLLSKPDVHDSSTKKNTVDVFTDLLAEVRKYGESLIIVDQIPNKLAPEVLKNTNTKIIHRIYAQDDKDVIGDMIMLDDKQKKYLSALETGEAIVFSENFDKPININVEMLINTSSEIDDTTLKQHFISSREKYSKNLANSAPGVNIGIDEVSAITNIYDNFIAWIERYIALIDNEAFLENLNSISKDLNTSMDNISKKYKIDMLNIWKQLVWLYFHKSHIIISDYTNWRENFDNFSNLYIKTELLFNEGTKSLIQNLKNDNIIKKNSKMK